MVYYCSPGAFDLWQIYKKKIPIILAEFVYIIKEQKRFQFMIHSCNMMAEENKHLLGKTKNESDGVLGNEVVVGWSDAA